MRTPQGTARARRDPRLGSRASPRRAGRDVDDDEEKEEEEEHAADDDAASGRAGSEQRASAS
jgi:hypothetical protein